MSPRGLVSHMSIVTMENCCDFPILRFVSEFNTLLFVSYLSYTPIFKILMFIWWWIWHNKIPGTPDTVAFETISSVWCETHRTRIVPRLPLGAPTTVYVL